MEISLFDYDLPKELIALTPSRKRDQSRLLIFDRGSGSREIGPFTRFVQHVNRGDAIVINTTKVFKARLLGNRISGAKVEIFLVRPTHWAPTHPEGQTHWEALVFPSRRVKVGEDILFGSYRVNLESDLGGGRWQVAFRSDSQRKKIISHFGHVPLPPYIKREDQQSDIRRYQTVFAESDKVGAVAAPTAGFHFTESILRKLRERGVEIIKLCLHVGPGTFKPVKVNNIHDHIVDPEMAVLSPESAGAINKVRASGGRIFAVGTTSVRTLESAPIVNGQVQAFSGMVDLYIKPGYQFKLVNHLLTNFHLPKSSLLILVSAFAGREAMLDAYSDAIENRMRFYSYGDAMLIL